MKKILGFSNCWYSQAFKDALEVALPNGIMINVVSPVYFLAAKFEVFIGRGEGNYFNHDLEDSLFVLENRKRMIFELLDCPVELKEYFASHAASLLCDDFLNGLPGLLDNTD